MTAQNTLIILKFAAILLGGTFAVLGLLTNFRDRTTGKITRWGKIALVGIIVSTSIGAITQSLETYSVRNAATAQAAAALNAQHDTQEMLIGIRRSLFPIRDIEAEIWVEAPVDGSNILKKLHASLAKYHSDRIPFMMLNEVEKEFDLPAFLACNFHVKFTASDKLKQQKSEALRFIEFPQLTSLMVQQTGTITFIYRFPVSNSYMLRDATFGSVDDLDDATYEIKCLPQFGAVKEIRPSFTVGGRIILCTETTHEMHKGGTFISKGSVHAR